MSLTELAAWAEALEPVFHQETPAGFICVFAESEGWALGIGLDAESSLKVARANALATRMQQQ